MRGALKGLLRYHRLRAITAAMTLIARSQAIEHHPG
jgi:hypothetical protein